jgi:hypothetical protein
MPPLKSNDRSAVTQVEKVDVPETHYITDPDADPDFS